MKKLLFLFLIVSLSNFGQGLNYEKGLNKNYNQSIGGLDTYESYFYVGENVNRANSFFSPAYISKYDTLGNQLWQEEVLYGVNINQQALEVKKIYSVEATQSGGVLVTGGGMQCCDCGGLFLFVEEYNSNGTLVWNDFNFCNEQIINTCSYTDSVVGTVAIFNQFDKGIVCRYQNGVRIDSFSVSQTPIKQVNILNDSIFAVVKDSTIFKYDFYGNNIDSLTYNGNIHLSQYSQDSLIITISDSLIVLSEDFQSQRVMSFNYPVLERFNDLRLVVNNNNQKMLLYLDSNFIIQDSLTIDFFDGIYSFSSSHLAVLLPFNLTMYQSIRLLDYSLIDSTNNTENIHDVEIVDMVFNDYSTYQSIQSSNIYSINSDISVLVKNNGGELMQNCMFNSHLGNSNCNESYYFSTFYNLNILPGDSAWVNLGWLGDSQLQLFNSEISSNMCVYTSNPNGKVDLNVQNDNFCKTLSAGYVSISDEINDLSVIVYPNPTNSVINIKSKESINGIKVFDGFGRLIKQKSSETKDIFTIDFSDLINGVYFMEIDINNIMRYKKILKQ